MAHDDGMAILEANIAHQTEAEPLVEGDGAILVAHPDADVVNRFNL
jgi:hypothetical protein